MVKNTRDGIDEQETKRRNKKIKKGQFNFNDFRSQMKSGKNIGNMKSVMGMIPGLSSVANQIKDIDLDNSKEILHIKAMINSMTQKERENPDLLNNSRKRRLAAGSGLSQVEVNRFLKQFENASKIAQRFSAKEALKGLGNLLNQAKNSHPN